jgi:hypothetical protein
VRVIALAAVLFLLAVSVSWGSTGEVSGSATLQKPLSHVKTRWRATLAKLPANAGTSAVQPPYGTSISCSSPGNCTAVGSYTADGGWPPEGLLLTEKSGHWGRGVEAVLPGDANYSEPYVTLNSVSCASAGNCTAVGAYVNTSGGSSGLLLTLTAGHWAAGVEAALPADAADPQHDNVQLNSVSCASAGNCTAVGAYDYSNSGLLLTETAGHWAIGVKAPFPSDRAPGDVRLSSVSCAPDGTCGAVGYYNITFSRDAEAGQGALLTNEGGTWRAAKAVMPPDGPGEGAILTSVSCVSAGNCGAIGLYNINIDGFSAPEGVLLTEKAGKWRRGVTAMPPSNANSGYWGNYVGLAGISCVSPGDCVATGNYYYSRNPRVSTHGHVTLLTETAGKWGRGVEAAVPRGARDPEPTAVSCASPGNCTVVGGYRNGRRGFGLLWTEIAGSWARGSRAPLSTNHVALVSCASPGNCGAVGGDSRGDVVLFDSSTKPCVVPRLKGTTLPTARHSIVSRNCSVGAIEYAPSQTVEIGHVISQTPQPGRHLAPGNAVDLTVSSG